MAISVDYSGATYRIIVPQADLTLISGSLYELDTDQFWADVKALESAETGIIYQDMQSHNSEYTIAGITYAQSIEILNATNSSNTDVYEVFFSPDTQYSVRLAGSNNNIFDLQNAILANTTTQIIPNNSAGLISAGSTATDIWSHVLEGAMSAEQMMRIMAAVLWGKASGLDTNSPVFRSIMDTKDRVTATTDSHGNRSSVTMDGS